ncbi:cell division protein FtsL [Enterococcus alcedinis]|uniref:Cell division protein FtsL n=1 Tax=Enterococcus alcedinis TaxID=1274384 RepID=A0A917JER3_9ENTE|nr:cell division protein FtsL [Enterococcus alcedinis]MBP2102302.1 cell division protein FtsL [Enterococcus alcedinis]GGI65860.1 cell division protein FtsL [Enterococcus alcedinis]
MAELKMEDYSYGVEDELNSETHFYSEAFHEPERPDVVVVPLSPKHRLKRISRLERLIAGVLLVAVIGLSLLMIHLRTSITQMEHEISIIEGQTAVNKSEILRLEQSKAELSKSERIREIAEKQGLSIQSGNLRKVK